MTVNHHAYSRRLAQFKNLGNCEVDSLGEYQDRKLSCSKAFLSCTCYKMSGSQAWYLYVHVMYIFF